MIEEFKDELKDLKNILNEIKELELLRKQGINELKNETKRKLKMLDDEVSDTFKKLDVNLTTLELRNFFCKKPYNFEKERIKTINKRGNKIKRLKEEVENNMDELLDHLFGGETNIFKQLSDLEYEKEETLHNIAVLELKLIKLGITLQIDKIKESVLSY